MGWRGALRTMGAMAREAERNAKRSQRQHERYQAAVQKANELQHAAEAVRDYEDYIEGLVSLHRVGSAPVDWKARAHAPVPVSPVRQNTREAEARKRLESYSPSLPVRLLGLRQRRFQALERQLEDATRRDDEDYECASREYSVVSAEYHEHKELADRLLADDPDAIEEVIKAANPFSAIAGLGSGVAFSVCGGARVAAELDVHGDSIIPKEGISLLKSGRASVKALPKARYYGFYQDYVCSAVLRVTRELFALIPIASVLITAVDEVLSSQTGNLEKQAILSVLIPRATFDRLNLATLDASDSMRNFVHRMDFRASYGFRPVEPLDPATAKAGSCT